MGWKKRFAALPALLIGAVASETIGWGWSRALDAIWPMVAEMTWRDMLGIVCWIVMIGSIIWMLWPWPKEPTKSERLGALAMEMTALTNEWRRDTDYNKQLGQQSVFADMRSACQTFEKAGFQTPAIDGQETRAAIDAMEHYFTMLEPLLRRNHYKMAKAVASQFCLGNSVA